MCVCACVLKRLALILNASKNKTINSYSFLLSALSPLKKITTTTFLDITSHHFAPSFPFLK